MQLISSGIGGGGANEGKGSPVAITSATDYDPQGDDEEVGSKVELAVDGNPTGTAWETEHYDSDTFAGTKTGPDPGVGVYVTTSSPARPTKMIVRTPTPGWDAQVFAAAAGPARGTLRLGRTGRQGGRRLRDRGDRPHRPRALALLPALVQQGLRSPRPGRPLPGRDQRHRAAALSMSAWRQARAIVLLPGAVTVLVPTLILVATGSDIGWGLGGIVAFLPGLLGLTLIVAGFALWLWTVRLLARIGKGTLAPWDPTQKLVVEGPYRHLRNPMITAVLAVLAGEAALFGSLPLLIWFAAFFAAAQQRLLARCTRSPASSAASVEDYRDLQALRRHAGCRGEPGSELVGARLGVALDREGDQAVAEVG